MSNVLAHYLIPNDFTDISQLEEFIKEHKFITFLMNRTEYRVCRIGKEATTYDRYGVNYETIKEIDTIYDIVYFSQIDKYTEEKMEINDFYEKLQNKIITTFVAHFGDSIMQKQTPTPYSLASINMTNLHFQTSILLDDYLSKLDPSRYDDEELMVKFIKSFMDKYQQRSFDMTFPFGHFTVSGAIVTEDYENIALMKHNKLNMWLQPGGHIEHTDTSLEKAVAREIKEEIGIDVDLLSVFDIDLHSFPERPHMPRHWHMDIRFLSIVEKQELKGNNESTEVKWVPVEKMKLIMPFENGVLRLYDKITNLRDMRNEK